MKLYQKQYLVGLCLFVFLFTTLVGVVDRILGFGFNPMVFNVHSNVIWLFGSVVFLFGAYNPELMVGLGGKAITFYNHKLRKAKLRPKV